MSKKNMFLRGSTLRWLLVCAMFVGIFSIMGIAVHADTVSYAVKGGNLTFDKSTGAIQSADYTVTEADIPSQIQGVRVTSIETWAFHNCKYITRVKIPSSVVDIRREAFAGASALESVELSSGLKVIGEGAFYRCSSLQGINLPSSLRSIGVDAFQECTSLRGEVFIPDGLTSLGGSAFKDCRSITKVRIAGSVSVIPDSIFENCASLESVIIEPGPTKIGACAFKGCAKLQSIRIPDSVTSMDQYGAFYLCSGLKNVELPGNISVIGNWSFAGCSSLESVTIPEGVMTLDPSSFRDCSSLKVVTMPVSVTTINADVFKNCKRLSDIYYGGTREDWNKIWIWNSYSDNSALETARIHYQNQGATVSSFKDVRSTDYFFKAVAWAVENAITNGTSPTTFDPNDGCTRAQVVTFLWRAAGEPSPTSGNRFKDVPAKQYYTDAVAWAVEKNITNGVGNQYFDPNGTCTRAQIVTFLWRYKGSPSASTYSGFSDVPSSQYYASPVTWAVKNHITNGVGNNKFNPNATCTRGQVVTFLYRL